MVPSATLTPKQQAWVSALRRAKALATVKPTYHIAAGTYTVFSARSGHAYTVRPLALGRRVEYACTCEAYSHGRICWHAALVAATPIERGRRTEAKAHPRPQVDPLADLF